MKVALTMFGIFCEILIYPRPTDWRIVPWLIVCAFVGAGAARIAEMIKK